jgi:iron complex transport system ATP-binding protein
VGVAGEVLSLTGVTVTRDGAQLLSDVSWTVSDGERWVILGPNGAGKTTLLRIASTYLFPTAGAVTVLGERLGATNVFELRQRVGLASSALTDSVPPRERVLDVVLTAAWAVFGRAGEGYAAADSQRAAALLTQLGCRDLLDRSFGTLSEGERKRVQIARALMTDPELLLLDEPAAGLDLGAREALVRRLSRLALDAASPVMVIVSHHVEEVPPGITHALLLRSGQIVAAGEVGEVMTGPWLSACFGVPLEVTRSGERYSARMATPSFPRARAATPA